MMPDDLIERLHATPLHGVIAITGGGSGAIERLLTTPGASRTVLEAVVPYSPAALADWLGGEPDRACDASTARHMAMRAFQRARQWGEGSDPRHLVGVGCTASLATDRPKRGAHRAYVAAQTADRTLVVTLQFEKGRRTRAEEERATTHAVVAAMADVADVAGVHRLDLAKSPPGIEARSDSATAPAGADALLLGERSVVAVGAAPPSDDAAVCLFPGSFNPPHEGHEAIARVAAERTGRPVVLELSITNVDKRPLDYLEIRDRLGSLAGQAVWLTRAPTFVEKARLTPGVVFAVGADTIERIGQPRYYRDEADRDRALRELSDLGARFLVFGRVTGDRFEGLEALGLPDGLRGLCDGVAEADFRIDISSTELRAPNGPS